MPKNFIKLKDASMLPRAPKRFDNSLAACKHGRNKLFNDWFNDSKSY